MLLWPLGGVIEQLVGIRSIPPPWWPQGLNSGIVLVARTFAHWASLAGFLETLMFNCVYCIKLKIQSTLHHLFLYHSNIHKREAGIHGNTLRIQIKSDCNLIHVTTLNVDTIPGFTTCSGLTQLTTFSCLNPINSSEVQSVKHRT